MLLMTAMLMAVGLEGVFDPEPLESLEKHMPPSLRYSKYTEREDLKLPSQRRPGHAHPNVPGESVQQPGDPATP